MKIDIKYDPAEFRSMRKVLKELTPALRKKVYVAGFKAAARVVNRVAKANAPMSSSYGGPGVKLRESFTVRVVGWRWDGVRVPKSAVLAINYAPHAVLVEKGTKNQKARPFMWAALQSSKGQLNSVAVAAMRSQVEREFKRLARRNKS